MLLSEIYIEPHAVIHEHVTRKISEFFAEHFLASISPYHSNRVVSVVRKENVSECVNPLSNMHSIAFLSNAIDR